MTAGASGSRGSMARKGSAAGAPGRSIRRPSLAVMLLMASLTAAAWSGAVACSSLNAASAAAVSQISVIVMTLRPVRSGCRLRRPGAAARRRPRCDGPAGLIAVCLACCAYESVGPGGDRVVADSHSGYGAGAGLRVHVLAQRRDVVLCLLEVEPEPADGEPGDVGKDEDPAEDHWPKPVAELGGRACCRVSDGDENYPEPPQQRRRRFRQVQGRKPPP